MKYLFVLLLPALMAMDMKTAKFQIIGNKKTNSSYIHQVLGVCNDNDRLNNVEEIQACLFDTMLFSKVVVSEEKATYLITVKERFYIIPVPMITASDQSWSVGIAVADMNVFGNGEILGVGEDMATGEQCFL